MIYDLSQKVNIDRALMQFESLARNKKIINIVEVKPRRSYSQNRYLHLMLGFFAMETGYTIEEAKQIYKRLNGEIYRYKKGKEFFLKSSADLDTKEMAQSVDKFRDYCVQEAGFYIPEPNEKEKLQALEYELKNRGYE